MIYTRRFFPGLKFSTLPPLPKRQILDYVPTRISNTRQQRWAVQHQQAQAENVIRKSQNLKKQLSLLFGSKYSLSVDVNIIMPCNIVIADECEVFHTKQICPNRIYGLK